MERKELLVAVLIGALLLTAAVQTIALITGGGKTAGIPQVSAAAGPAQAVSAGGSGSGGSLADLPSMVGGC